MDKEILIYKYLNKQLLTEEKKVFEELLNSDLAFKEEVLFQDSLKKVIREEERISLKKELNKIGTSKKFVSFSKWMAAASICLLILSGGYFYFLKKNNSNQVLFSQNFTPATNVLHPIVRDNNTLSKIEKAFVNYEYGNYNQFLNQMSGTTYHNLDYDFYIANAHLAIGNTSKAISILTAYTNQKKVTFLVQAHWYLALAFIKEKNYNKAKEQIELIKNEPDIDIKKVESILSKIN
ncbi:MAG: hypothetical protein ACWA45_06215 [Flavobacteriales bacterium]